MKKAIAILRHGPKPENSNISMNSVGYVGMQEESVLLDPGVFLAATRCRQPRLFMVGVWSPDIKYCVPVLVRAVDKIA